MTWTSPRCYIPLPPLTPEEREEQEVLLDMLKVVQEHPERFLMLFQPRLNRFWVFNDRLFDKICKLVKKEVTKEIAGLEARSQQPGQGQESPFIGGH